MKRLDRDTAPEITTKQIELLRLASPARKLALVGQLNQTVRTLALSGLRARYPHESPEQIHRRLADLLLGSELAEKAFGKFAEEKEINAAGTHPGDSPGHQSI